MRSRQKPPQSTFLIKVATSDDTNTVSFGFDQQGALNVISLSPKLPAGNFTLLTQIDRTFTEKYGAPTKKEDTTVSNEREWGVPGARVELDRAALPGGSVDFMFVTLLAGGDSANAVPLTQLLDDLLSAVAASSKSIPTSTEGYRDARWGMSPPEVAKLVPSGKISNSKDTLIAIGETAGKPSATGYSFANGRLSRVVVMFTQKYVNENSYLDDFQELKLLLTEKYGKPADDSADWRDRLYADDPSKHGMAGFGRPSSTDDEVGFAAHASDASVQGRELQGAVDS